MSLGSIATVDDRSVESLGIEKGKPFAPSAETKRVLNAGIRETQMVLDAKYDAGSLLLSSIARTGPCRHLELSQAAEPARQQTISARLARLATVMPTLASNGWVQVSST